MIHVKAPGTTPRFRYLPITNLKMLTLTTLRTIEVASVNIELLPASLMRSGGIRRDERSKRHFNPSEGQRKRDPDSGRHPPARMRYEMRSAAVVAYLGLVLLGACDKPQPAAEVRPVRTVTASAGSDGEPVSLTGHIHARTEESLSLIHI